MIDWADLIERRLHIENDDESHVENDAFTFHASQLGKCKRQVLRSKFGLEEHDTETLGRFALGTLIHSWIEEHFADRIDGVEFETYIEEWHEPGVRIVGHADVYDEHENAVYDFKTRSGWYNFDPPVDRHMDQLALYMDALDAERGKIVYISKKTLEVKTYPPTGFADPRDRVEDLIAKARTINHDLEGKAPIVSEENIPYDRCGCWLCDREADDE